mmetsp:Transcript_19235/g.50043  ORF Transcript_19235/g.50043 Transcript_19235/m.50043 type:complete len:337 (-) Transcript_19235:23-1033(-)
MATLTPTSPADSFIVSDSGDDESVWAMDLDDEDDAADTPPVASPVGPNVTVGRVCARAAAARARALDRARAMARADAYLDLNGEARQAHAARQVRLDHLRRECAALRLSAALVLASAPDAVVADADELLDQGYAADEVLAVVAATQPATAAAARRRWEVDDDEGPPLKSGMDRSATIARGLVRLFFADGATDYARCAAACDPTHYARDAASLRLLSKLDLPLEIGRLVGEFAVQSPLARFSMVGRVDGAVLARLLRPHIDGVVGKLKRTKHFGRVVAVARGAALPAPKAPRRPKKKPLPKWNASSIKRDPRGVARHCLRGAHGRRCFCVECWSSSK